MSHQPCQNTVKVQDEGVGSQLMSHDENKSFNRVKKEWPLAEQGHPLATTLDSSMPREIEQQYKINS
jgi:hypothetical protein